MNELVVLCPNPFRDIGLVLTEKIEALLHEKGYAVSICPVFGRDEEGAIPEGTQIIDWDSIHDGVRLAVVIGGDGTILHTARKIGHRPIPLIGVNLGTKGFMSVIEPEKIGLIAAAADGDYVKSERMMVDVSLMRGGERIYSDSALNDVVIHGMGDCIKLTAWCDGDMVTSFSGDGIIVSTPTGSTGYSMSAGGPVVEPEAKNIILSPICAHVIGAKSFVLAPDRKITVKAEKIHDRRCYVSVDGEKGIEMFNDDLIIVTKSLKTANLVHMGQRSFYDIMFDKLMYRNS